MFWIQNQLCFFFCLCSFDNFKVTKIGKHFSLAELCDVLIPLGISDSVSARITFGFRFQIDVIYVLSLMWHPKLF